jgi:hypothetical protein
VSYVRRSLTLVIVAAAAILVTTSGVSSQPQRPTVEPRPSPNAPNPNFPPGLNGPEQKSPDKREMDRRNQAEVKADVERLYQLISELREQVQKSDATSTLSISVVKKAHEIEKLAKQVSQRAKG